MDKPTQPTPDPAPAKLSVSEFLDGQLGMLSRRMSPEERAEVIWWRARIRALAKQAPKAEPLNPEHPGHVSAA